METHATQSKWETLNHQNADTSAVSTVFPDGYQTQIVAAWTADGSNGYYYDLPHNRGRAVINFQLYDTVKNEYVFNLKKSPRPLTGSETIALRIWLHWDPGADRIEIGYI